MADQNLEILVDVDISSALANLDHLIRKLSSVAREIEQVNAVGTNGIDVHTNVQPIDHELAVLQAKIEMFERQNSITIGTNVSGFGSGGPRLPMGMFGGGSGSSGGGGGGSSSSTSRSATKSASSFFDKISGLQNPMEKFDLRMSDLHNALAKLVPLILVLVGAVPALYTAMIGLAAAAISAAAALLAIGGFGALGVGLQGGEFDMQRLSDVLSDIRTEFIEAFGPLSERLEPLFMDAVGGLSLLFDAVARNGDALMQLTDDARAFGQFLLSFIPSALASMAAMVETMRPVFSMMADAIDNASILRTLTALTLDIIPAVAALTSAVIDILPALVRFSAGFASILGGILTAIDFIGKLVSILPLKAEALGAVTAAALTLASAFAILNGTIFSTAVTMLLKLGAAIQTQIVQLLGYKAATTSATIATYGLTNALRALLAVTGVGLVLVGLSLAVSSVGSVFNSTESDIRSTTDALKEFDRVAGRTSGAFNPYGGDAPVSGSRAAGGGGQNVAVIEPSGNPQEQSSDVKSANWRMGRKTEQGGI